MTIPSERLIEQITNAVISSDCCRKQYDFRDIRRIDGLGVLVTIYLDTNLKVNSSFGIKSRVLGINGNIYVSKSFYGDGDPDDVKIVIKKSLQELYRILPDLKADKLNGELHHKNNIIDLELGTTYMNEKEICSVCLEPTLTQIDCRHYLCICCQDGITELQKGLIFDCPLCRQPHYKYDFEEDYSDDGEDE